MLAWTDDEMDPQVCCITSTSRLASVASHLMSAEVTSALSWHGLLARADQCVLMSQAIMCATPHGHQQSCVTPPMCNCGWPLHRCMQPQLQM